ncbi:asparagine synthase-related protein [Litchfieldia alkalitelluris]|uniref:asparagine synthase-related protein n=1 Tax=Litchfieldia alkalitelluris TaxID=304268 RepID=UPI0009970D79|nr:asparagine synthase-related protein [Litchfieldia alkalitelluris]
MSAITGIVNFCRQPVDPNDSNGIMKYLEKYPSDDVKIWKGKGVFLGCHSQWITPESIGEVLPYYCYESKLTITSDSIIDNRIDLFDKLQIDSEYRKFISDSQLILLAYEKWKEDAPQHLIGDFAFMIWDEKKNKLFGARDFSGARTLYYYNSNDKFVFSTALGPFFTLPYIKKQLNDQWIAEFLAVPGMADALDPRITVYKNIYQIPPSHSISVKDGEVKLTRYCNIQNIEKLKLKSDEEYEEAFRDVFKTAVKSRIRTFGKVGVRLSGGLDSGTVASFAADELRRESKRLYSYSYVPECEFVDWTPKNLLPDERPYIANTVNHIGNITANHLDFKGENPFSKIDSILDLMESPYKFFENSFWLNGISEKSSKDGIKILLNGARGNHSISFGSPALNIDYYANMLKTFRWYKLNQELESFCENFRTGKSVILPILYKELRQSIFSRTHGIFKTSGNSFYSLLNPKLANETNIKEKLREHGINNHSMSEIELRDNHFKGLHSWNTTGTANTKLSLKYSLMERDPTNDIRVIRFCLSVPHEQYIKGGLDRSLIRRATKSILPDTVRLNNQTRGIQIAEVINRMESTWPHFVNELKSLIEDPMVEHLFNLDVIKNATKKISSTPKPFTIFDSNFRMLTRSLVVYRFIKNQL